MNKKLEQIEQDLDAKIPRSVVSERDGGGGRRLSYLEGHYVIDRLNKIFGPLRWSKEIVDVTNLNTPKPSYLVRIKLTILNRTGAGDIVKEGIGYGSDKGPNNPHELAIKEAVTDALKVAAKDLGMSLGLALYDKTQENVDDEEVKPVTEPRQAAVETKPSVQDSSSREPSRPESSSPVDPGPDKDKLRAVIRSHVKAAVKKGVTTTESIREHLESLYGVSNLDGVSSEAILQAILKYVQQLTK